MQRLVCSGRLEPRVPHGIVGDHVTCSGVIQPYCAICTRWSSLVLLWAGRRLPVRSVAYYVVPITFGRGTEGHHFSPACDQSQGFPLLALHLAELR